MFSLPFQVPTTPSLASLFCFLGHRRACWRSHCPPPSSSAAVAAVPSTNVVLGRPRRQSCPRVVLNRPTSNALLLRLVALESPLSLSEPSSQPSQAQNLTLGLSRCRLQTVVLHKKDIVHLYCCRHTRVNQRLGWLGLLDVVILRASIIVDYKPAKYWGGGERRGDNDELIII